VSLDYCADQYVLELLPRDHILALSPDAEADFSYHRERAAGLDKVRPVAEDVIALEPGMVVRYYGGGPQALPFFERAGIPVVQVPYANDLDGVRAATRTVARELGVRDEGEALVTTLDTRLANVEPARPARRALYVTSGGATAGPGTLIHEVLLAAGLENFETEPGWHVVPLERLAYDGPDLVVASFFDGSAESTAYWSAMRHPVARRQLEGSRTLLLPGSWTACGAWFVLDAVEALAAAR
jgi:iron complex transport system substrate-binding protein